MRYIEVFKIVALFIGTVIGAGFATGKEIVVFFGEQSSVTPFLAGITLGGFCGLFLYMSNSAPEIGLFKEGKNGELVLTICAFFSYVAMYSGAEYLLQSIFHVKGIGYISCIISMIFTYMGVEKIKWFNLLVIPILVILIFAMYLKVTNWYLIKCFLDQKDR